MNTDQEFIQNIKAGNHHLLEPFYKINFPTIAYYIKQNGGNEEDAKDVFQEAMIVLLHKVKEPSFVSTSALSTYLFAISKNIWLKQLRDNKFINAEQFDANRHDTIHVDENEVGNAESKILDWLARITKHCQLILKALFFQKQLLQQLMLKMGWKNRHTASNQKYKCIQQLKKASEKEK